MGLLSEKGRGYLIVTAVLSLICALVLSGCSTTSKSAGKVVSSKKTSKGKAKKGGGYYLDDGPTDEIPENLMAIPDAEPRVEKLASGPNKPYTVFGKTYTPMTSLSPYRQRGVGSWYGKKFHGQKTSSGELYDMFDMTAAHPILPIPSYARVTSLETGKQVIVRVNDRGPFLSGRLIDLSYTAAYKLGYLEKGSGQLEVELLLPDEIERINQAKKEASWQGASQPVVAVSSEAKGQNVAIPEKVSSGQAYYLQLGAYQEASNAHRYQEKFLADWSHRLPALEVVQSGNYYKLFAGPFNTHAEAMQVVQEMKSTGTDSFVVRR